MTIGGKSSQLSYTENQQQRDTTHYTSQQLPKHSRRNFSSQLLGSSYELVGSNDGALVNQQEMMMMAKPQ